MNIPYQLSRYRLISKSLFFLLLIFCTDVTANSIYSAKTGLLHTAYLHYLNHYYDVTFQYDPSLQRLYIAEYRKRAVTDLPIKDQVIEVANDLGFSLSHIQSNGRLYAADVQFATQQNYFQVSNVRLAEIQQIERGQIISFLPGESFTQRVINFLLAFSPQEIDMLAAFDVQIYRVNYKTSDSLDHIVPASALIAIPASDKQEFPLLALQHETIVLKNKAPTQAKPYIPALLLAATGYYVVVADYPGFGASEGLHPIGNARLLSTAVIDAIRAGRQLATELGVTLNDKLFLTGYSEGGYVTMATQRAMQLEYPDEFNITASAPLAGSYDISGVMTELFLEDPPHFNDYYLPYLLLGNNPVYGFQDSQRNYFNTPYDTDIVNLYDGLNASETINDLLPETQQALYSTYFYEDLFDQHSFLNAFLYENDVYRWVPEATTRLFHCVHDEQVPFANAQIAFDYFIMHEAMNVELTSVQFTQDGFLENHVNCAIPIILQAVDWFKSF